MENCTLYGNVSSVRSYYYDVSNGRLDYSMVVIGPIKAPKPRSYYDDPKRDNGECARELMGDIFKIELKLDGEESPEELTLVKEFVAGCIQTTGDLGTGFDGKTVGADRVKIDSATGKVTIEPDKADPTKSAEFFQIVIPKDPERP